MVKVENKIPVYEFNGEKCDELSSYLIICSHWNYNDYVVIKIASDKSITVSAADLIKAIENSTNWK